MTDPSVEAAADFARRLGALWDRQLGKRLEGAYLIGSLAHGGFSARYSDIDMAAVSSDPLTPDELEAMRAQAIAVSPDLAPKLSIFWADRRFAVGRFPPLDRVDYLDHAVAIVERERIRPARPSLGEIRDYLLGQPLQSWIAQALHFASLPALQSTDHKPYLRCLLYPARLLYSWATGAMASNDDAVAFLRQHPVGGLDLDLIERALAIRHANADLDPLFSDRTTLPRQQAACAVALTAPSA